MMNTVFSKISGGNEEIMFDFRVGEFGESEESATVTLDAYHAPVSAETQEATATTAGGNDGKVLTDTLWSQSGTIVITVDGTQKSLTGYTYNQYCPYSSGTTHSVTGCTNTADSQVLYYWLDHGYTFTFTTTESDYYYVKKGSSETTVYLSNAANYGAATSATVNAQLADCSKYQTGNFIAALNYYCGIKQHSTYGTSTSTTYYCTDDWQAQWNAKLYRGLGFDSHYFVYCSNTNFFTSKTVDSKKVYYLTDLGYSIVRECLDYGEVIRVDIPGHSIYLDGYQWNASTEQYEYHLNYGWGKNSSTKWYTTSELQKSGSYITAMILDLTPDISVSVSSDRSDYCAGSMTRGLERINHTQNDTATEVTFADALAGKSITAASTWSVTSNVDVEFVNFSANFVTSQQTLIQSAHALTFDALSGVLVANKSSAYAVKETGNEAVTLTVDGGAIFAGYSSASLSVIAEAMKSFAQSGYSAVANYESAATGYAVSAKNADDSITLTNHALMMGNVKLGGGNNVITISSSLWYGALAAAATLTFDMESAYTEALYKLSGSLATFKNYASMVLDITGLSNGTYAIIDAANDAANAATLDTLSMTMRDGSATSNIQVGTPSGDAKLIRMESMLYLVLGKDVTPPEITLKLNTDLPQQSLTLTAATDDGSAIYYNTVSATYSGTWTLYTAPLTVTQNSTLYFKSTDAALNTGTNSITITNIDKTPPELTLTPSTTAYTKGNVTVTATCTDDRKMGTLQYKIGSGVWQTYTAPVAVSENNTTVTFLATDYAGNQTEASYTVTNIDRVAPTVDITPDITSYTKENVKLTAAFADDRELAESKYRIGNGAWQTYTAPVVMTDNGTVTFYAKDRAGNETTKQYTVSNIDRIAPTIAITSDPTGVTKQTVSLTADCTDNSKVVEVKYRIGSGAWQNYTAPVTIGENNTTVTFYAKDAAGNETTNSYTVRNIDKEPPVIHCQGDLATLASAVTFSAYAVDAQCSVQVLRYSLNGGAWVDYSDYQPIEVSQTNTVIAFYAEDALGNGTTKSIVVDNVLSETDPNQTVQLADKTYRVAAQDAWEMKQLTLTDGALVLEEEAEVTAETLLLDGAVLDGAQGEITAQQVRVSGVGNEITGSLNASDAGEFAVAEAAYLTIDKALFDELMTWRKFTSEGELFVTDNAGAGLSQSDVQKLIKVNSIRAIYFEQTLNGVNKLIFESNNDLVIGFEGAMGTVKNDSVQIKKSAKVELGNVDTVFDFGVGKDTFAVNANAEVTLYSDLRGVATLKVDNGAAIKNGKVSTQGTTAAHFADVAFEATGGAFTIGKFAEVSAGNITGTAKADKLTVGSNSEVVVGTLNSVETVSLAAGSAYKAISTDKTKVQGYTVFTADDIQTADALKFTTGKFSVASVGNLTASGAKASAITVGQDAEMSAKAVVTGIGNDKISTGKNAVFTAESLHLGGGKNTLALGSSSQTAIDGAISGVSSLTVANGTAAAWTEFSANALTMTDGKDTLKIGNFAKVNIAGLVNFSLGADSVSIGSNSEVVLKTANARTLTKFSAGKNSKLYLSSELVSWVNIIFPKAKQEKAGVQIFDIGTHGVAANFTSLEAEIADNVWQSAQSLAPSQSVNGWLDTALDSVDFFECADASSLTWSNDSGALNLSQFGADGELLSTTVTGGNVTLDANAAYVSIAVDTAKKQTPLAYTLTLA